VIAAFVPYPTRVFPPLTLQVVDQAGRVPERLPLAIWRGVTNVDYHEEKVAFDTDGRIHLSQRVVWASLLERLGAVVRGSVAPHSGGVRETWGDVSFEVPKGYTLDARATGVTGTAALPGGPDGIYLVSHGTWGDYVNLSIWNPGARVGRDYRVVLKPNSPAVSKTP